MARTMHVKKAQQRYKTKPVIDPATGEPKRTPVMKGDKQKTTKRGTPVFMSVTERDLDKPLPPYKCDFCQQPIEIGTPYKYIDIKTSTYGSMKKTRHESCPQWKIWEYSNSWSARIARVTADFDVSEVESPEEVQEGLDNVASDIKELAEESREAASNIEDGFGHPTASSEEAEERAENLENWADEIEGVDIPDLPEPEEQDCEDCDGTGEIDEPGQDVVGNEVEKIECATCEGTGRVTPEDPTEEQLNDWRSEVEDACAIVFESPV